LCDFAIIKFEKIGIIEKMRIFAFWKYPKHNSRMAIVVIAVDDGC